MASVLTGACLGQALEQLEAAVSQFGEYAKFYMMQGQISEAQGRMEEARASYQAGVKKCPTSVALWLLLAGLDRRQCQLIRARSVLEKARQKNPHNPRLWLEAVRLEQAGGHKDVANAVLSRVRQQRQRPFRRLCRHGKLVCSLLQALQDCPNAGLLWAESIFMDERPKWRVRSIDALKRSRLSPFFLMRRIRKASGI